MKGKGLKIVVLVAPVHDCLNPIVIEPGGKRIDTSSLRWVMNPYDAFALEEALRLRDSLPGSRMRVITMASEESERVIRECLAVGADEAARIWEEGMQESDPYATAYVLATFLRKQRFDLVLCGSRRADLDHAQVGPAIAELLDVPQVTSAREIQLGQAPNRILVRKRVPGFLLKLSCPLPAVITLEKGQPLRYPKCLERRRASKAGIPTLTLEAIGLTEESIGASGSITVVERFTPPKPTRRSAMASAVGTMSAAARLQRIMSGGVQEKKDSKIWECNDKESVKKVTEHILKEKLITL